MYDCDYINNFSYVCTCQDQLRPEGRSKELFHLSEGDHLVVELVSAPFIHMAAGDSTLGTHK